MPGVLFIPGSTGGGGGERGPEGPTGPKGEYNNRGEWSNVAEYAKGDAVQEGGSSYAAIKGANIGHKPSELGEWWSLIAKKGDPGATGGAGEKGATGEKGLTGEKGEKGTTGEKGAEGKANLGTAYGAATARKKGDEWEPSASKYTYLLLQLTEVTTTAGSIVITVNGKAAINAKYKLGAGEIVYLPSLLVPPGGKVKIVELVEANMTLSVIELE